MNLRELRDSKGVSQAAVARTLHMTPAAICRIENTGTTLVTTLEAYASAIGVTFGEVHDASLETRKRPDAGTSKAGRKVTAN